MLIGPPRGCPFKAMRFPLKKFQDCAPKAVPPAHQPHRSRSCDLWLGSPSANYCVWKEPEHGQKRNKAFRLLERKRNSLPVSLHILPKSEPEVEPTIWRQPSGRHFTAHSDPGLEISLMSKWRWGEVVVEINCLSLVSAVQKTSSVQPSFWKSVSQGQWIHPFSSPPSYIWFNRERRGAQTELWGSVL